MRSSIALPLTTALLAACGGGGTLIEGTLLEADDARQVWVDGAGEPTLVQGLAFQLDRVPGDTIDLLFGAGDDDASRMRIIGGDGADRLILHGVWLDDEIAFPTSIELAGARVIEINGLRMGSPGPVGERVDMQGTVLALAQDREHAFIRPLDPELPDLRVVIAAGTAVRGIDGEEASLRGLGFGDTVTVRGSAESGYVIASELILSRGAASGLNSGEAAARSERRSDGDGDDDDARDDDGGGDRDDDEDRGRDPRAGRDGGQGRDEGRGRAEGRGRDEARGRDDGGNPPGGPGRGRGPGRD